jgi:hypothetical protein
MSYKILLISALLFRFYVQGNTKMRKKLRIFTSNEQRSSLFKIIIISQIFLTFLFNFSLFISLERRKKNDMDERQCFIYFIELLYPAKV